jgi:hypothetical protein
MELKTSCLRLRIWAFNPALIGKETEDRKTPAAAARGPDGCYFSLCTTIKSVKHPAPLYLLSGPYDENAVNLTAVEDMVLSISLSTRLCAPTSQI